MNDAVHAKQLWSTQVLSATREAMMALQDRRSFEELVRVSLTERVFDPLAAQLQDPFRGPSMERH